MCSKHIKKRRYLPNSDSFPRAWRNNAAYLGARAGSGERDSMIVVDLRRIWASIHHDHEKQDYYGRFFRYDWVR
jgi:hypothetical protein